MPSKGHSVDIARLKTNIKESPKIRGFFKYFQKDIKDCRFLKMFVERPPRRLDILNVLGFPPIFTDF